MLRQTSLTLVFSFSFSLLLSCLCALPSPAQAEADAKGCKDHPLFTRLPGYHIERCEKKYEAALIKIDEDPDSPKNLRPEGDRYFIKYAYDETAGDPAGFLQIRRNYQNAAKQQSGAVLVDHPRYTALRFDRGEGNVYAGIEVFNEGRSIELTILVQKAMKQDISASMIWDALQKDGFVTLYIDFDTNKADVKSGSLPQIRQVAAMLKTQQGLDVSIEGHTDSQGTPAANKTLSLNRAKSVVALIAAEGIEAERLSAQGWGQEKPIADNRTEDGRARNRRVEIIKKTR